jgi:hypothetical protein
MGVTTNFNIPYPDGPEDVAPLQTKFAAQASALDTALLGIASQIPMLRVTNAVQRDQIYPTPKQGDTVSRNDKGWVESYYELYSASLNPGGTSVAGWYPVMGKLPRLTLKRTTPWATSGSSPTVVPYDTVLDTVGTALSTTAGSGRITANLSGRYRVKATNIIDSTGTGYVDHIIRRNGTDIFTFSDSMLSVDFWQSFPVEFEVLLSASQYVEIYLQGGAGDLMVNPSLGTGSHFSVQYISPPFPNNS